jgi:hypothetical protein
MQSRSFRRRPRCASFLVYAGPNYRASHPEGNGAHDKAVHARHIQSPNAANRPHPHYTGNRERTDPPNLQPTPADSRAPLPPHQAGPARSVSRHEPRARRRSTRSSRGSDAPRTPRRRGSREYVVETATDDDAWGQSPSAGRNRAQLGKGKQWIPSPRQRPFPDTETRPSISTLPYPTPP